MDDISSSLFSALGLIVGAIATGVVGYLGVMWTRFQQLQQVKTDQLIALERAKTAKMLSDVAVKSIEQTMPNATNDEKKQKADEFRSELYNWAKISAPPGVGLKINEAGVKDKNINEANVPTVVKVPLEEAKG